MLKLQKRIENKKMFFIVLDYSEGCIKDMFYFSEENQYPLIENRIYQIMSDDLEIEFKDKSYSRRRFQISLLTTYRICIEDDSINFKNSMFCNEFYNYMKFDRLITLISYLRGKITLEGLENCKNSIIKETNFNSLNSRGVALYEKTHQLIAPEDKNNKLFKEFLLLAIDDEYKFAQIKILKQEEAEKKQNKE